MQETDDHANSAPKKPRTETNKETSSLPPDFFDAGVPKEEVAKDNIESDPPVNKSPPPANESGPPAKTEVLPPGKAPESLFKIYCMSHQ